MKFDSLAQIYFNTPEDFRRGLNLLMKSYEAENKYPKDFNAYQEHFLDHLDDELNNDSHLLAQASHWDEARKKQSAIEDNSKNFKANSEITDSIKEAIESLRKKIDGDYKSSPLSEAYENFINENSQNWKENGKLYLAFRNEIFPIFNFATNDCKTNEINVDHITKYKELVLKLPANKSKVKKYKNLSLEDIYNLDVPESDQVKPATKKNYLDRLTIFLDWMCNNNYCRQNLSAPLKNVIKNKGSAYKERNKFSNEDLTRLFNSTQYQDGTHDRPFKFWIPLIGILSGARINEIAQLTVDDVYKNSVANCWILDINTDDEDDDKKSLKRDTHKRQVPIHPVLIKLGLPEYAEILKRFGEHRLFPELPFNSLGNYGITASKWFNNTYTNKNNCGTETPKSSFHSLRHNFIDYIYSKLNTSEAAFAHYLGQSAQGGVGVTRYSKPTELINAYEVIKNVQFTGAIDFTKIREWSKQRFGIQIMNNGAFIKAWVKDH